MDRAGWTRDELIDARSAHLLFGRLKTEGNRWPKERLFYELEVRMEESDDVALVRGALELPT